MCLQLSFNRRSLAESLIDANRKLSFPGKENLLLVERINSVPGTENEVQIRPSSRGSFVQIQEFRLSQVVHTLVQGTV